MIVGELPNWKNLNGLNGLEKAFRFLEESSRCELSAGKHTIAGDELYALVIRAESRPAQDAQFESHQRYIDVHYLIDGVEMIGFAPRDSLKLTRKYEEEEDTELFELPSHYVQLTIRPGQFVVFFPGDAHLPGCHTAEKHRLNKIVMKAVVDRRESESIPG
jgi:YhcH/YjgK/YiaL family protein